MKFCKPDTRTSRLTDRGYTGHEHLDGAHIINMPVRRSESEGGNGRMPARLSRNAGGLSPDPVLQNPYSTQNYNRYSYVVNNPLKYTDPSGYQFERLKDRFETEVFDERENNGSLWAKYQGKDLGGDRSNSHWADYSDWSQVKYPGEYDYEQEQAINLALYYIAFVAEMAFYSMNQQELHYYGLYNPRPDGNPASGEGAGEPWIPHPRRQSEGIIGKSSLDNLRVRVTEFDKKFDGGVYAEDDPSNKAAISLVKGFSKTFPPTSVLISGSTMATGQDQFTGQNVYGFDRWGTPAIDILFNAPGVPLKLVLFWNLMNNPGVPTSAPPNQ